MWAVEVLMISVTDKALNKIKEISEAEGIGHFKVRLNVIGGGCAGFSYDMHYDDFISDMDDVYDIGGVTVIVDAISMQYLEGVEIDWIDGPFSSGFKFINPNVSGTCGCGNSFSVGTI